MSTVITAATIIPIAKALADKVAISLVTKSIIGGVGKIRKKSPEERVAKALERALQVVVDNGFWKNDVKRQVEDVIRILIHALDNPQYFNNNPLPHYLDEKTIVRFKDCLKEDPEAWDYIQKVHYEEILQDIRTDVRETKAIVQDTNTVSRDTNEIVRRIEGKLEPGSASAHYLTDIPSKADSSNVIGREENLSKLWKILQEKHHVLLTGFGGIGKTKLAQMLFHTFESQIDEVAWVEYQGDLKSSFLGSITAKELQFEGNEDDRWRAMKSVLTNDKKEKLFIIDNVDHVANQHPEQDTELHHLTGWSNTTVLLTSRLPRLENYAQFSLDFLDKENSIKVFNHYYPGKKTLDQTIVAELVELADRHTLTVELLAKGAWQYNIEEYCEKVKKGFNQVDETIQTTYHEREEDSIEGHLRFLFSMKDRSELEKQILNSFAVLPNKCRCTKEEIEHWFGFKKKDWNAVLKDGWLSYDEKNGEYFMHPLVRTIVRFDFAEDSEQKNNIAPVGTAEKLLQYFASHKNLFLIDVSSSSLQKNISIVKSAMSSVVQEESACFAALYNNMGYGYKESGKYNEALKHHRYALEIRKKILGEEHITTAESLDDIGSVFWNQSNYDEALMNYSKALEIREKTLGENHTETASSYHNVGLVYREKGDYDKALDCLLKALEIREKVLGTKHLDTASSYNITGTIYKKKGNYYEALDYYCKALRIREKEVGTDHSLIAFSYNNIGQVYYELDDNETALGYFNKALIIRENLLGTNHPYTATLYNNIGLVYKNKNDYNNALAFCTKALEIRKKTFGTEHPYIANSYSNIGDIFNQENNLSEALECYKKALEIREKRQDQNHPYTAFIYCGIALVNLKQGNFKTALEYYTKAYQIRKNKLGEENPYTKEVSKSINEVKQFLQSSPSTPPSAP